MTMNEIITFFTTHTGCSTYKFPVFPNIVRNKFSSKREKHIFHQNIHQVAQILVTADQTVVD